jgi:hypothetical protein
LQSYDNRGRGKSKKAKVKNQKPSGGAFLFQAKAL